LFKAFAKIGLETLNGIIHFNSLLSFVHSIYRRCASTIVSQASGDNQRCWGEKAIESLCDWLKSPDCTLKELRMDRWESCKNLGISHFLFIIIIYLMLDAFYSFVPLFILRSPLVNSGWPMPPRHVERIWRAFKV
jgi:hypothetical protein